MTCEYDCCECGIRVVNVTADVAPEPPLCGICLHLPGWQSDPRLREIFGTENRTGTEANTKPGDGQ